MLMIDSILLWGEDMIIEIALAIVLAFIILAYLDRILVFSAIALVLGVIVIVIIGLYDYYGAEIDNFTEQFSVAFPRLVFIGILFYIGYLLYLCFLYAYKEIKLIGFLPFLKKSKLSIFAYIHEKNLLPSIITISIFITFCFLWIKLS